MQRTLVSSLLASLTGWLVVSVVDPAAALQPAAIVAIAVMAAVGSQAGRTARPLSAALGGGLGLMPGLLVATPLGPLWLLAMVVTAALSGAACLVVERISERLVAHGPERNDPWLWLRYPLTAGFFAFGTWALIGAAAPFSATVVLVAGLAAALMARAQGRERQGQALAAVLMGMTLVLYIAFALSSFEVATRLSVAVLLLATWLLLRPTGPSALPSQRTEGQTDGPT